MGEARCSARGAMRDTLLAATMAPSLRALAPCVLLLLLLYPAVRTHRAVMPRRIGYTDRLLR